jgi:hypothetical protein
LEGKAPGMGGTSPTILMGGSELVRRRPGLKKYDKTACGRVNKKLFPLTARSDSISGSGLEFSTDPHVACPFPRQDTRSSFPPQALLP